MDESLRALEERLEQLVPKGLSDDGRERMEEQIEDWASALEDSPAHGKWKWALGVAAAVLALVAVQWNPSPRSLPLAGLEPGRPVPIPAGQPDQELHTEDDLMELLTLSLSRSVQARTDRGLMVEHDAEMPHRYWSYEVTNEEELMDKESGYAVRVVSRHEEWVPVAVNQL